MGAEEGQRAWASLHECCAHARASTGAGCRRQAGGPRAGAGQPTHWRATGFDRKPMHTLLAAVTKHLVPG